MRGAGEGDMAAWMTAGTGQIHQLLNEHDVDPTGDDEKDWAIWRPRFPDGFVEFVRDSLFQRFLCPVCEAQI